jgi:hypothetical protein
MHAQPGGVVGLAAARKPPPARRVVIMRCLLVTTRFTRFTCVTYRLFVPARRHLPSVTLALLVA